MKKIIGWFFIILVVALPAVYCIELYLFICRKDLNKNHDDKIVTTIQQYLHPYYFFSFPTDKKLLKKLNFEYVWVDHRGFGGGVGPEKRGQRKLAFVLGGSTAFGQGGSRPESAISFQLNKIQNEYFFINAGVPSWNTFQELLRLLKQLISYKPSLVISLTGYNDIADATARRHLDIPLDAPDSYEHLYNWVEKIRSKDFRENAIKNHMIENTVWGTFVFFNLKKALFRNLDEDKLSNYINHKNDNDYKKFESLLIKLMFQNLELMKNISETNDFQYKVFLQPNINLHDSFYSEKHNYYKKIYDNLVKKDSSFIYNFSKPFNKMNKKDILDHFEDEVHLNDKGYKKLAKLIWQKLKMSDL